MKTVNQLVFENLDDSHYTTTTAAAKEYNIFKNNFKDVLGYDDKTNGSLALQKGHEWLPLLHELPTAVILKNNGHAVVLISELGEGKHADALVDGILSEFRQVRKMTIRAIKEDFYEARKKGAKKIVLDIKDASERDTLFELLKRIASNPMVNQLQDVFLIVDGKLEKFILKDLKWKMPKPSKRLGQFGTRPVCQVTQR